jgi:putative flippase GtrA
LVRFAAIILAGLAMNSTIVTLLAGSLGTVAAKAAATVMVLGWNFFANRRWTFTEKRED